MLSACGLRIDDIVPSALAEVCIGPCAGSAQHLSHQGDKVEKRDDDVEMYYGFSKPAPPDWHLSQPGIE